MKTSVLYIAILMLLLTAQSCEKKPFPVDNVPEPQFKVTGEIGGESLDMAAGSNGYFLFTDADQLVDEQWLMSGKMAPSLCPECGPSLEFILYGTENGPSNPIDINEVLQVGSQEFHENEDYLRVLDLGELFDQIEQPFVSVNDEEINQEIVVLDEDDDWVEIEFIDFDGIPFCQTEIGFDLDLFDCNEPNELVSSFPIEYGDAFAYVQAPPFLAEQNIPIAWYIGWDGLSPDFITVGNESVTISLEIGGPTTIIAAPAGQDFNDWTYFCAQTVFDEFEGECPQIDFGVHSFPQDANQVVEIRYTNESGELFTSSGACAQGFEQPQSSSLSISEIEDYVTDNQGNPTKRFRVQGNFELQSTDNSGNVLQVSNLDAKIALAYPSE